MGTLLRRRRGCVGAGMAVFVAVVFAAAGCCCAASGGGGALRLIPMLFIVDFGVLFGGVIVSGDW